MRQGFETGSVPPNDTPSVDKVLREDTDRLARIEQILEQMLSELKAIRAASSPAEVNG